MRLVRFRRYRPPYELSQSHSLDWLARAHARAEGTSGDAAAEKRRASEVRRLLDRFGCGPDRIARRGHWIEDCNHDAWDRMRVYRLSSSPRGAGMRARMDVYRSEMDVLFRHAYAEEDLPPSVLVHVTCTGYVSPSPAQKLVAERGWGDATEILHAYHMGCYAAIPALRMARGALASVDAPRVDLFHTELCSLHVDLMSRDPAQLVLQTLFADGAIRYAVTNDRDEDGFELLSQREIVAPGTAEAMEWIVGDSGMQMTLSREVPARIATGLPPFVERLCQSAGLDPRDACERALFAVHPGGPKILDDARQVLGLEERQLVHSRGVLRDCGNMSSATLPHIWAAMLEDPSVAPSTPVVSLAFGPGLTIAGAVLRKAA